MLVNDFFEDDDKNPCWKGYTQYGMKKKNGKKVPNCVPEAAGPRFDEPLTGWHIVYRSSGNPVHGAPSFESKDAAQKYLMTKMFKNHHEFKVVHTAHVGVAEGHGHATTGDSTTEARLVFKSIELTEHQIRPYVQKYFEAHKIEAPFNKFVANIRSFGKTKINESEEMRSIKPFIDSIKLADSTKTIKVGDQFAVLAFDIMFAWKEINATGFITPKEVVAIKLHSDGTINYIKFADGDRYPRLTPATYSGKPVTQTAYFDDSGRAKTALSMLLLKVPQDWEIDTSGIGDNLTEFLQSAGGGDGENGNDRGPGLTYKEFISSLKLGLGYDLAEVDVSRSSEYNKVIISVGDDRQIQPMSKLGVKHAIAFIKKTRGQGMKSKDVTESGKKVTDLKTGLEYDPEEMIEKMYSDPEYVAQMQRMGREEGRGWPARKDSEKKTSDTNNSKSNEVVKSVLVGNFRHDLVNNGPFGYRVQVYYNDTNDVYYTGLSKNSVEKGLLDLADNVAYTKKQLRITDEKPVGEASDPSGLWAASELNKSFIITAKTAEGATKKFRVRAQSERVAREKFSKHHNQAEILSVKEEGVTKDSESSLQRKIQAKRDALSLAREQRRVRGNRQQGQREIKLQADIDRLSNELTQLKKQGMAEGYTGRETKPGTWRVFKDGQSVAVAGPFKSPEEARDWIKKQEQGVTEAQADKSAAQRKAERDQQRTAAAKKARDQAQRKGIAPDKTGTYYPTKGVSEGVEQSYKVTYDIYGSNKEKPLYTKTRTVRASSEQEAIDTLRKLVGGTNYRVEKQGMAEASAPDLLKAEMPLVRHVEGNLEHYGYVKGTKEWEEAFNREIAMYRKFGNVDMINKQGMAEGADDTNDYYADYYTDLLSQVRNMSLTDKAKARDQVRRDLASGKVSLADLKMDIRDMDREINKQGMAEAKTLPKLSDIENMFRDVERQMNELEVWGADIGKDHPLSKKWQELVDLKQKVLRKAIKHGVAEGLKFHGGFPDVDHMPGPVIRDADVTTNNVRTADKAEWERAVNSLNAKIFDDNSEVASNSKGTKVVGNNIVWAIWNNEKQVGWFNAKGRPLKPGPVKESGQAAGKTPGDYETLAKKHTADGQKGTRANMGYASKMAGRARRAAEILKSGGSQEEAWQHYQGTSKDRDVAEAKSLNKRVRIVKTGETGTIRQVKHGAFKGAPKAYFVDLDNGKQADNLPASALRLIKDEVAEGANKQARDKKDIEAIHAAIERMTERLKNPGEDRAALARDIEREKERLKLYGVKESANPQDKITVDVPLLLRLLEYAREDAKTDMDLHDVTEQLIKLSAGGQTLTMQDYSAIVKQGELEEGALYPGEYHEWVGKFDDGSTAIIKTYSDDDRVRDAAQKQFPNKNLISFDYRGIGNMGLTGGGAAASSKEYHQQQQQIEKGEQFARAERDFEKRSK